MNNPLADYVETMLRDFRREYNGEEEDLQTAEEEAGVYDACWDAMDAIEREAVSKISSILNQVIHKRKCK